MTRPLVSSSRLIVASPALLAQIDPSNSAIPVGLSPVSTFVTVSLCVKIDPGDGQVEIVGDPHGRR